MPQISGQQPERKGLFRRFLEFFGVIKLPPKYEERKSTEEEIQRAESHQKKVLSALNDPPPEYTPVAEDSKELPPSYYGSAQFHNTVDHSHDNEDAPPTYEESVPKEETKKSNIGIKGLKMRIFGSQKEEDKPNLPPSPPL